MLWLLAIVGWLLAIGLFAVLCVVAGAAAKRNLELEAELRAWTGQQKPTGWFGEHES